ncbi:hypothetical protein BurJ1DRAFT_1404 [Burkholderiales bacterium JOSHI_001]|nr:hypothetical protein BurJ1DRAFT_1404 [Burkholderiales bacterium JOSHI_001]
MAPPRSASGASPPGGHRQRTGEAGSAAVAWRPRRMALVLAAMVVLLALLAGLGAVLFARSEAGARWALRQVPGLQFSGLTGSPLRDTLRIEHLRWQAGPNPLAVEVHGLQLQSPRWTWRPYPGAWIGLDAPSASAQRVLILTTPSSTDALKLPTQLRLPLEARIDALAVDELRIDQQPPLNAFKAQLHLGADLGRRHSAHGLTVQTEKATLRGDLSLGSDAPMPLDAQLALQSRQAPPWSAQLKAQGPLARLQVQASLRGQAPAGGQATLDATATVTPEAAWPLAALALTTRDLDLASLVGGAPHTRLSADAQVQSSGLKQPVTVALQARNATPGRWDLGHLPISSLNLQARTTPADPQRVDILALQAQAASADGPAGRVQAQGEWTAQHLRLKAQLDGLQPARLDARAPALLASGPLEATLAGLPGPAAWQQGAAPRVGPLDIGLDTTLQGHLLSGPRQPLQLALRAQAQVTQGRLVQARVGPLNLQAGAARAQATLALQAEAGERWHLVGQGELSQWDPLPWWPGAPAAWRNSAPHRLGGPWRVDLHAPARAPGATLAAWLQAGRGDASLSLANSQLAGQPLAGDITLKADGQRAQLAARLASADNRAQVDAQLQPSGADDRWQLSVVTPRVAALAPFTRLVPALAAQAWPDAGDLDLQAQFEGRWPQMRSSGQARLAGLKWKTLQLAQAQAQWQAGTDARAPLDLRLTARDLRQGEQRLDSLDASVQGTPAQHRLSLALASPVRPPAWTESLLGDSGQGTRVQLTGNGAWQDSAPGGGQWQGRIAQLSLAADRNGSQATANGRSAAKAAEATPWLAAQDLVATLRLDPHAQLQEATLAPGRAQLPAGAALRWSQFGWQREAGSGGDRLDLSAELEALAVAPLLARFQPELGWTGDLRVGARIELHARERFEADIVFERVAGDLRVSDESGTTQALGLTDLRLGLVARDGVWQFTQGVAGALVGEMAGAQVLRTTPQRRWPAPDTPLDGVLEMRVANLAAWGTWVPPGWRLGGALRVSAGLGGRFSAPELRGELQGNNLSVRNPLQGVGLSDGELQASLQGTQVRVDTFSFKGGDGRLLLSGGGTLGAAPSATLQLKAERFRVLGRLDRRLVASGQAQLQLNAERLKLDGDIAVDDGLFDFSRADAPSLDEDVVVRRAAGEPAKAPVSNGSGSANDGALARNAPLPTALRNAQVDLKVDLGAQLRLRGHGLDTGLRGELRITSPGGRLAVNGTVRAQNGTYVAYGQKMSIERGEVAFSGPLDNARLDIRAVRPNLDVVVGVAVTGSTQNPRIRLFSEPEMSDLDKLSWLVLGRAADGLGRTDTALLQRAAVALLAGEGEAPTDALIQSLGLTDFSLRQTEGDVRETVVSLGRQLSRRWYVGYERSVNATTGTWQLVYRIAQRFTLRAQSGQENSLDLIWSWRW